MSTEGKNKYISKIEEVLDELEYYSNILLKKTKGREVLATKLKDKFKEDKNSSEIKDFAFDAFFMSSFQNLDLQILRAKFVSYVELYLMDEEAVSLSDKVMEGYNFLKPKLPKRMFLAKDGNLVELNEGDILKKKEMFEKQNLFEMVEAQLKQVMKNV